MLRTGCNLPYIPSYHKKRYFCKNLKLMKKNAIYPLMRSSLSRIFLSGICFQQRDFICLKKKCCKHKTNPERKIFLACKNTKCEQMQYILNGIKPHHFFVHNMCLKARIPLLKNPEIKVLFQKYALGTVAIHP